ncbi:cytochrome c oxidase assembly protein [Plastorhodobacter daqingensis]|uniref:Cytochrome c oxidase assembly protein CtaG n=1 Tax=Plastorhodobacter daqingensis TaxID=1387281 RepID=A0ABW2UQN3_9RHOB
MAMNSKTKTAVQLIGVVVFMGSMAWAAVPFYDWFCRVTGFGGTPGVASAASGEVLDRTIRVRFDASRERGMPWEFRPMQREMEVRIGEVGLAFYEAYNPSDEAVAGTASYNVTPYGAGGYFTKIDCFCFQMQVLQPGERVEMPVTFYVDPAIVNDRESSGVHTITLSYTFHVTDMPREQAALLPAADTSVN